MAALAVTGNGHEVERNVDANVANQVGEKDGRALKDTDQVHALAFEILRNLKAHLPDALLNRATAQKNPQMLLSMRSHSRSPPLGRGYSSSGACKAQAPAQVSANLV